MSGELACVLLWSLTPLCVRVSPDGVGPKGVWMTSSVGGYCAKWDSDAALLVALPA